MRSLLLITFLTLSSALFAQTAPPPAFDEDTKGEPAVDETNTETTETDSADSAVTNESNAEDETTDPSSISTILGDAKIKEYRRENGQLYQIELDHSAGSKQYIQDDDSDGKIQATDNDLQAEPNLPKWRLGRW